MKMTIEDIREYSKNAVNILKRNDQYATAKAVEYAFSSLIALEQIRWERDIAIEQLSELGIGFGEKIDGVYLRKKEYEKLVEHTLMFE